MGQVPAPSGRVSSLCNCYWPVQLFYTDHCKCRMVYATATEQCQRCMVYASVTDQCKCRMVYTSVTNRCHCCTVYATVLYWPLQVSHGLCNCYWPVPAMHGLRKSPVQVSHGLCNCYWPLPVVHDLRNYYMQAYYIPTRHEVDLRNQQYQSWNLNECTTGIYNLVINMFYIIVHKNLANSKVGWVNISVSRQPISIWKLLYIIT